MSKPCKECPWVVKNKHNDSITTFSKRTGKKHNCHMVPLDKIGSLWDLKEKHQCQGNKLYLNKIQNGNTQHTPN